jgi:hypothetical protein
MRLDPVDAEKRDDLVRTAARDGRIQTNGLIARSLQRTLNVTLEPVEPKVFAAGERRTRLDPKLDINGNILPRLLEPRIPRPADLPADSDWNDGSELQYLKPYQPFVYGASTFALAYNYHRQAQVLQEVGKQRHVNLSEMVVDSRNATSLRNWAEEEMERGRRLELWAFNVEIPEEKRQMEVPSADIAVDTPFASRAVIEEAIYTYELSARLAADSLVEYEKHLQHYANNLGTYQSAMDGLRAQESMMLADANYMKAMLASGDERKRLLTTASRQYADAEQWNLYIILRYYMDDYAAPQVLPAGVTRNDLSKLPRQQYRPLYEKLLTLLPPQDPSEEDRSDYQVAAKRAELRIKRAQAAK